MNFQEINALIDRFDASSLSRLALTEGDWSLQLEKGPVAAPAAAVSAPVVATTAAPPVTAVPQAVETGELIRAPLLGSFYVAPEPGAAPFVTPGQRVKKGETLCILEAMKLRSDLPAPMDCTILEVLAENGAMVEYDAPLFRVEV